MFLFHKRRKDAYLGTFFESPSFLLRFSFDCSSIIIRRKNEEGSKKKRRKDEKDRLKNNIQPLSSKILQKD